MKNFIVIALIVLVVGSVWFVLAKKDSGMISEVKSVKVGIIYKGDNFKKVVNGFQKGFLSIVEQKKYQVEYVVENVEGAEQADFDLAAQRLVNAKVNLILAVAVDGVIAAKKATLENKIPIILVIGSNPVSLGLVASIQRPGDNITGVLLQVEELTGKRLEFLKKIDPRVKSIVVFKKKGTKVIENSLISLNDVAKRLGVSVVVKEVETREDFEKVAATISRPEFDSIFYAADPFISRNMDVITKNLLRAKMPSVGPADTSAISGALSSYGPNFVGAGEQSARLAAKILIDKQLPGDLPIESVLKVDFILNLVTAQKIGITIPSEIVELADTIIRE
jgi:putative ABC transport system substrate-binding protein